MVLWFVESAPEHILKLYTNLGKNGVWQGHFIRYLK